MRRASHEERNERDDRPQERDQHETPLQFRPRHHRFSLHYAGKRKGGKHVDQWVDEDIDIEFVGLRPGEKLFEELSHKGENITPTTHPKIMRFVCDGQRLTGVQELFGNLESRIHSAEVEELKLLIKSGVLEYQPYMA